MDYLINKNIVKITNQNPYTKIGEIESITFDKKPKYFGIGFNAGYGISKNGLSPYIGVGINYNLLKF